MSQSNDQYWNYDYIPELADTAVPSELQKQTYNEWAVNPTKENMSNAVRMLGKLINSELSRYQGTLPRSVLRSFAKKYTADAIKSYDPSSGNMLSTHAVHNIRRLHRLNYRNVQGLRAPEEIQAKINDFIRTKENLENLYDREPTREEIAKEMGVPPKTIDKLNLHIKTEYGAPQQMQLVGESTFEGPESEVIDMVHHDLAPMHKKVMEFKTGYNNTPILTNSQISKKLNLSPVRITQISQSISNKLKTNLERPTPWNKYLTTFNS